MKKKGIPRWLLIVDIVYAVCKIIKHCLAGAMGALTGVLSNIPFMKGISVGASQPKVITFLLIALIVLNVIFLIRSKRRKKMIQEVSSEVIQEIKEAKSLSVGADGTQKMDLFG